MGAYSLDDRLGGFHSGILNVDRTDADLLVSKQSLVVMRHVVFDQAGRALYPRNEIGLVAAGVEVAVADLAVILLADGNYPDRCVAKCGPCA